MKPSLILPALACACGLASSASAQTNFSNWRWVREGGTGGLLNARAVATDDLGGYSCVAGSFIGTVALGPSVGDPITGADGPPVTVTAVGTSAAYVVQYNDSGQVLWAHAIDGGAGAADGTIEIADVDIVTHGTHRDCVIAGSYAGDVGFGSALGATTVTAVYGTDAFVARYGPTSLEMMRELIGYGADVALGVSVSESGDIAVGGHYDSATYDWLLVKDTEPGEPFGPDFLILTGDGGREGFAVSYDAAGTPRWGEALGGPGDDEVRSVAASGDRVFVAGGYENGMTLTMYWGGTAYVRTFSYPTASGLNPFLVPLDAADGHATWTEIVEQGTGNDSWYNHVYADAGGFDGDGVVMITGTLQGINGPQYLYYHVLDYDLNHREAFTASTAGGASEGVAGRVDTSGDDIVTIWLAGRYTGTVAALGVPASSDWNGFVRRTSDVPTETFVIDGTWSDTVFDLDASPQVVVPAPGGGVEVRYRAYVAGSFPFNQQYSESGDVILTSSTSAGVAQIGGGDTFFPPQP